LLLKKERIVHGLSALKALAAQPLLVALLVPYFFVGVDVFTKLFPASGDIFLGLLVGDAGAMAYCVCFLTRPLRYC
jgi:hypothetical protein